MKTVAVVVHWGPVGPTLDLVRWLSARETVDETLVVANDLVAQPADCPVERVSWIVPDRNLGYAAGADLACARRPGADCYLVLNNDLTLTDEVLDTCLRRLRDDVGVVAPTLVNEHGVQSAAGSIGRFLSSPRVLDLPPVDAADVEWVTGACLFIRGDCYRQVGLDGRFFLCFEDVDFCWRARKSGWRVVLCAVRAWHEGSVTIPAGRYIYYIVRNRLWFVRSRRPPRYLVPVAAWAALYMVPRVWLVDVVTRRGRDSSRLAAHGLADGLGRLPPGPGPLPDEPRCVRWATWDDPALTDTNNHVHEGDA